VAPLRSGSLASILSSSSGGALGSARTFSSASGSEGAAGGAAAVSAAAEGDADEEGRVRAPVGSDSSSAEGSSGQQGTADEPQMSQAEKDKADGRATVDPIIDVDPYPKERMSAIEKRYDWVDWNAMANHLHMGDVHFFDQEVPYMDQDFTIRPDFRLLHRLEGANRLKTLQEHEDKKILRLLDFGYWITSGRTTRVATEGKISSVWTMVVGGDQNGTASFGFGKAADMALAEKRAMADLRRNMLFVPLFESRTLSHEIRGRHGVCQVRMWPRPRSHGMTAGMIPRMIFECFGIQDITAKVDGRALPHHQALAIFNGLREVKVLREEAARRGVTAHKMFERGLHKPRNPGRAELLARGNEVTGILRDIRATQVAEEAEGVPMEYRTFVEPSVLQSPLDNPRPDKVYVPGYIELRPEPTEGERHRPGPLYPNSKRAAIKETLFKRRGLPQPTTRRTLEHTRLAGRH